MRICVMGRCQKVPKFDFQSQFSNFVSHAWKLENSYNHTVHRSWMKPEHCIHVRPYSSKSYRYLRRQGFSFFFLSICCQKPESQKAKEVRGAVFTYYVDKFFWVFLPLTPLLWHFLPHKRCQKMYIFGLPTHLFLST